MKNKKSKSDRLLKKMPRAYWKMGFCNWIAKLNNDLEKKNALIKAYQKYNLFLEEQLSNAYTYANLHGYNCSESDMLQGETLRENIREIFYKEI